MSGIVRGWTDSFEINDLVKNGGDCRVFASADHPAIYDDIDPPFPVAVVPLDDATLAGMAERFLELFETNTALGSMRAALGLGGEGA